MKKPFLNPSLDRAGLDAKIKMILEILRKRGWSIGIMESCTGGAISNALTNIPGASDVFKRGLVTYSDEAKIKAGVEEEIIKKNGVYSMNVAEEMARKIEGEVGVGVTGNLPGQVYIAVKVQEKIFGRKIKIENGDEDKIEGRKEMKKIVLENVVDMIIDGL